MSEIICLKIKVVYESIRRRHYYSICYAQRAFLNLVRA